MNREQAERVFQLVGDLRGDLHDRLVPDRWWMVWVACGFEVLIANGAIQMLLAGSGAILIAVAVAQVVVLAVTIRLAQRNAGGSGSQRETFIWWIWTSFLIAGCLLLPLNSLLHLRPFCIAPLLPLLASFGFSMMGMAVDRKLGMFSPLFVVCVAVMALYPAVQFFSYGVTWFLVLETLGLLHRPGKTRPSGRTL